MKKFMFYELRIVLLVVFVILLVSCKDQKALEVDVFNKGNTDGSYNVKLDDKLLMSYAVDTRYPHDTLPQYYKRSGFIHPLKTLNGVTITDGFPVGHTHQHGLFSAWTKSTFRGKVTDFWNQAKEEAIVKHRKINPSANNNEFSSSLEYIVLIEGDSVVALTEDWDMSLISRDDYYIVDWQITQSGNGSDTLLLNKYHYGGPAFRGSGEWNIPNNFDSICYFTTNEGLNHIEANHTRPLWASMYGKIGSSMAGIGIIQAKENIRYPQFIRIHPSMPYYCFIPTVEEPYAIGPHDKVISNYRLVVFDGEVNSEIMNQEMEDFNSRFETRSYTLNAIADHESIELRGFVKPYIDKQRKAIAIDATKYKGQYAAASYTFDGEAGNYNLKLRALAELDGESNYRIAINNKLLDGIKTNPVIHGTDNEDYTPALHVWKDISLESGDEIRVESSSETNGKIPEGDITAYSRGRFTSVRLDKVD